MELGEYLKWMREQRGLPGAATARDLGMTPQQLNDLEAGRVKMPGAARLARLASFYGVSIEQLLSPPAHEPTRAVEFIAQARRVLEPLTRHDNQAQEAFALMGMALGELQKEETDDEDDKTTQAQGAL